MHFQTHKNTHKHIRTECSWEEEWKIVIKNQRYIDVYAYVRILDNIFSHSFNTEEMDVLRKQESVCIPMGEKKAEYLHAV